MIESRTVDVCSTQIGHKSIFGSVWALTGRRILRRKGNQTESDQIESNSTQTQLDSTPFNHPNQSINANPLHTSIIMDRSSRLNRTLLIGGSIAATIALGGFVYSIIQNRKQSKQETNAASNNQSNPTNQPNQPTTTTPTSTTPQENSGSETRKTVVIGTRSSQVSRKTFLNSHPIPFERFMCIVSDPSAFILLTPFLLCCISILLFLQLALWQAHYVQELLQKKFPDIDFVGTRFNTTITTAIKSITNWTRR